MTSASHSIRQPVACGLFMLLACITTAAHGQENPAATYDEWKPLESAEEMREYRSALGEGVFDENSRKFLRETALPQLGKAKNRAAIDFVRRRMREVLCAEQGVDPKAIAAAMQAVTDFMIATARDTKADIVLRSNAVLMVGELRIQGGKPWPPAVAPLVAVLGDDALPPAVRIAAAAGLARHVEADPEARSADIGPALVKLLGAPLSGVDPVAADWLRSRAVAMLARMGPAAPAGTVATAAGVLRDPSQSIDLRVRAAAVVGACIKAPGDTDVAAAVTAIRDLAATALQATQAGVERRGLTQSLTDGVPAGPRAGGGPVGVETATPQLFRRDAWRLATLADALVSAKGDGGLAGVAGAQAPTAADVATALREAAGLLDAQPDEASLTAALEALTPPAGAATSPAAPANADPAPAAAAPGGDGFPFGN